VALSKPEKPHKASGVWLPRESRAGMGREGRRWDVWTSLKVCEVSPEGEGHLQEGATKKPTIWSGECSASATGIRSVRESAARAVQTRTSIACPEHRPGSRLPGVAAGWGAVRLASKSKSLNHHGQLTGFPSQPCAVYTLHQSHPLG
jgi:hypothetical protein